MSGVISDEMLDTFVPTAPYSEIARVLEEWYGDLTGWLIFPVPSDPRHDPQAAQVIAHLRGR